MVVEKPLKLLNPEIKNHHKFFKDNNLKLEVGKFYYVVCVVVDRVNELNYIPIIGHAHSDPEFGEAGKRRHYHIDGRFETKAVNSKGKTNSILFDHEGYHHTVYGKFLYLEIKLKRCKRLTTGLDVDIYKKCQLSLPSQYQNFLNEYAGKSCKGKKCPHRGYIMEEIDGQLVCPLHGLIGDKKTELIISQA